MRGIDINNIIFQCSTRCGHGYERRQVQCVNASGQKKRKKLCSKPHRPAGRRSCYNGPCESIFVCLIDSLRPINNLSVM